MSSKSSNKTANQALVEKKENLPAVSDYADFAGQGFEDTSKDDYSIPFLAVLQGLSKAIENIPAAKPGMILNTATNDVIDGKKGVVIVPCLRVQQYVEWVPRDQGGGFVAIHDKGSDTVLSRKEAQGFGKMKMVAGDDKSNDLVETFYMYGIMVGEDGRTSQVLIAFASTAIKAYKNWMNKASAIQIALPDKRRVPAPLFAHRYRLTTHKQTNKKGEFYNFLVDFDGVDAESCRLGTNDPTFKEALAFRDVIMSGKHKVQHETQKAGGDAVEEEEIPFG